MLLVAPEGFVQVFQAVAMATERQMLECWTSDKAFTSLMRSTVLPAIAGELGLLAYCERDYYWLDAIFYEEADIVHFKADPTYAKYISVALEHENLPNDSVVEMNKLQLFNTPLKVLVTYAKPNVCGELLKKYARIVSDADIFDDFSTHRKQIVIFGDRVGNQVEWTFYVYREGLFVIL